MTTATKASATVDVVLHRVVVTDPVAYIPTGPTTGVNVAVPPVGSFDPAKVRIAAAPDVRAGDIVLGTIQPHYGPLLTPLDRAQWVSYFSNAAKAQQNGARPWDPAHCWLCMHHGDIHGITARDGWVTVDGCTAYSPDSLLLIAPRELVGRDA